MQTTALLIFPLDDSDRKNLKQLRFAEIRKQILSNMKKLLRKDKFIHSCFESKHFGGESTRVSQAMMMSLC